MDESKMRAFRTEKASGLAPSPPNQASAGDLSYKSKDAGLKATATKESQSPEPARCRRYDIPRARNKMRCGALGYKSPVTAPSKSKSKNPPFKMRRVGHPKKPKHSTVHLAKAMPTRIFWKRAGAAPWPVPMVCMGWPLPQLGVPQRVQ
jgi:hypothetical protein